MRYLVCISLLVLVPFIVAAQDLRTTPATVQLGMSQLVTPSEASEVFRPGLDVAVRGRLGGEGNVHPTIYFGFERRWGSGVELYGTDLRFGARTSGQWIFGAEGGVRYRYAESSMVEGLSGARLRPIIAGFAAYRTGHFQVGPEVSASVASERFAAVGVRVGYVIR